MQAVSIPKENDHTKELFLFPDNYSVSLSAGNWIKAHINIHIDASQCRRMFYLTPTL